MEKPINEVTQITIEACFSRLFGDELVVRNKRKKMTLSRNLGKRVMLEMIIYEFNEVFGWVIDGYNYQDYNYPLASLDIKVVGNPILQPISKKQ